MSGCLPGELSGSRCALRPKTADSPLRTRGFASGSPVDRPRRDDRSAGARAVYVIRRLRPAITVAAAEKGRRGPRGRLQRTQSRQARRRPARSLSRSRVRTGEPAGETPASAAFLRVVWAVGAARSAGEDGCSDASPWSRPWGAWSRRRRGRRTRGPSRSASGCGAAGACAAVHRGSQAASRRSPHT